MTTELDVTAGLVGLTSTLVDRINALDERMARIERELVIQNRKLVALESLERQRWQGAYDAAQYDPAKPLPDVGPTTKGE